MPTIHERYLRSPARRAVIERRAAFDRLPQLAHGLLLLFAIATVPPLFRSGALDGLVLAAVTAIGALAMVWLRRACVRGRLPRRWAHPALGLSLALVVVRGLMGWAAYQQIGQIGILGLIVLAIGYTCVSAAWMYGLLGATALGCVVVPWLLGFDWSPPYVPILIFGSMPVAVMIREGRLAALWRAEEQRVLDRVRHARLLAATERADESELRFRGIFERINDVYVRVGLDGLIQMVSPSVTRLGYQPQELIGTDASRLFAPNDLQRGRALIGAHAEVGDLEMSWRRPDGSETVVSVSGNVLRDASGTAVAYEGILRDISERKRLEEERREQQAALAHVLRLSSMGEMAAEMAHELTQPLGAIVNYAGACARYVRSERDERAKLLQGLELISAQGLRAGEIVRRIRSYVTKRPPQRETVDLLALADQAVRTVSMESRRTGLPIVVVGVSAKWLASVDAIQIEQVLVNLLLNALEAVSAPGAGDQITMTVGALADGSIEIAVSDPGRGLGDVAERVFDAFFSTKPTGLGMGLAISRSIVESHGGRLWATPNSNRGTTFRFTVPRGAPPEQLDELVPASTLH